MADSPTGEKSEEATPQKMRDAKKKGQVGKSPDVASALSFAGSCAVLGLSGAAIGSYLQDFMVESFSAQNSADLSKSAIDLLDKGAFTWLILSLPLFLAATIMGLFGNYIQIGFIFSTYPLQPKLEKINPINGFKQMFSAKKVVQLLQQMAKFILVALVVRGAIEKALFDVVRTQGAELILSLKVCIEIVKNIVTRVAVLFLLLAAVDFLWQRRVFKKSQMMSKYDVKREYKQSEGDPQLKSDRKRLAHELIMQGSQANTAKADAVITNPVFLAAAIKYDPEIHSAPILVAKGMRKNAEKIRNIADENSVPILRNVPLVQALYKLEIDEEIPEQLYDVVAEVLNFVYELKRSHKG